MGHVAHLREINEYRILVANSVEKQI